MYFLLVILASLFIRLGATGPVLSTVETSANLSIIPTPSNLNTIQTSVNLGTVETPANLTKQWTLYEVRRKLHKKHTVCHWRFHITESMTPDVPHGLDLTFICRFKVRVLKPGDCRAGDFGITQCDNDPDFFVSGGHDKQGFLNLTVSNAYENSTAYFVYLDSVLDAGGMIPPQTSPVHVTKHRDGTE
ncbi:hypothetical protein F4801DRAFT_595859 [Xylaria longipes]|nr:hypothetical protein F4801DRAFT_595859 [Xylaria longipes]